MHHGLKTYGFFFFISTLRLVFIPSAIHSFSSLRSRLPLSRLRCRPRERRGPSWLLSPRSDKAHAHKFRRRTCVDGRRYGTRVVSGGEGDGKNRKGNKEKEQTEQKGGGGGSEERWRDETVHSSRRRAESLGCRRRRLLLLWTSSHGGHVRKLNGCGGGGACATSSADLRGSARKHSESGEACRPQRRSPPLRPLVLGSAAPAEVFCLESPFGIVGKKRIGGTSP